MFSLFRINLRQIVTVFLSVTLFIGTAFNLGNIAPAIAAEAITSDVTNLNSADEVEVSDAEYEADKISRQRRQAMRSQAEAEAQTKDTENESIAEKLNLDEALPRSTKKFVEQITGDEPD